MIRPEEISATFGGGQAHTILFVSHTGIGGGGAEVVLGQLIDAARSLGYRTSLATPEGELIHRLGDMCDETHILPLIPLRRTRDPLRIARMLVGWVLTTVTLGRIIVQSRAWVVHANSGVAALACLGSCTSLRKPLFWHQHDIVPYRPVTRLVLGLCGRLSTKVVAVSVAVRRSLIALGIPASRVVVLHNAVRPHFFEPLPERTASRRELGLPDDGPVVAMIGRVVPYKGHRLLLEAIAALMDRDIKLTVAIAGSPPVYEPPDVNPFPSYLDEMSADIRRFSLDQHVVFLGRRSDVRAILAAADILVVPSIDEPFPLVVLEGMAAGHPVVASDSGGHPEALIDGESGILFRSGDSDDLARALERMLGDRELRTRLGDAARRRAHDLFSEERFRDRLSHIYEDLMVNR